MTTRYLAEKLSFRFNRSGGIHDRIHFDDFLPGMAPKVTRKKDLGVIVAFLLG